MVKCRSSLLAALQLTVLLLVLKAGQLAAEVQNGGSWSPQPSHAFVGGNSNSTETDAELLLDFKNSFSNGDSVLASWVGSDPCTRKWLGISCDANNSVVSMQLPRASLSEALVGFLPSSGWKLPDTLESVNLTGNNISGTLPSTWQLPTSLLTLSLASNRLYGILDKAFYMPSNLAVLDLSYNRFIGSVPHQFSVPPEDWIFDVGTQDPWEGLNGWWVPSSLRSTYLQGNDLSGSVPTWKNSAGDVRLYVLPGNERLCGTVPWTPKYLSTQNSSISLPSCHISVPSYTPPSSPSSSSTSVHFSTSWVAVGISFGVVAVMVAIIAIATAKKRARLRAQASAAQAPAGPEGPAYPPHTMMGGATQSFQAPPPPFEVGYPPPAGQTWVQGHPAAFDHGHPAAFKPPPMVEVEIGGPGGNTEDYGDGAGPAPTAQGSGRPEGGEYQEEVGPPPPPRTHDTPGQSTSVGQGAVWTAAPVKGEWRR